MTTPSLRIGTRASRLAMCQTDWVVARLREARPDLEVEVERIRTGGDRVQDRPLHEIGGKGLFLKEIEEAILDGRIHVGVHSMKDVPAELPEGLELVAVPSRGSPGDVLVARNVTSLRDLPRRARIGTGSLRRGALARALRPDLEIVPIRGNVETRLRKWRDGEVDAVILARAGLDRLGLDVPEAVDLPPEEFLPAIGQGALALEATRDSAVCELVAGLEDPVARTASDAERAVLRAVSGDCRTPVAAYATVEGGTLHLDAVLASPDGRRVLRGERRGTPDEAARLGLELGREILGRGGREILRELRL